MVTKDTKFNLRILLDNVYRVPNDKTELAKVVVSGLFVYFGIDFTEVEDWLGYENVILAELLVMYAVYPCIKFVGDGIHYFYKKYGK